MQTQAGLPRVHCSSSPLPCKQRSETRQAQFVANFSLLFPSPDAPFSPARQPPMRTKPSSHAQKPTRTILPHTTKICEAPVRAAFPSRTPSPANRQEPMDSKLPSPPTTHLPCNSSEPALLASRLIPSLTSPSTCHTPILSPNCQPMNASCSRPVACQLVLKSMHGGLAFTDQKQTRTNLHPAASPCSRMVSSLSHALRGPLQDLSISFFTFGWEHCSPRNPVSPLTSSTCGPAVSLTPQLLQL